MTFTHKVFESEAVGDDLGLEESRGQRRMFIISGKVVYSTFSCRNKQGARWLTGCGISPLDSEGIERTRTSKSWYSLRYYGDTKYPGGYHPSGKPSPLSISEPLAFDEVGLFAEGPV